jgi:hypothetical protein
LRQDERRNERTARAFIARAPQYRGVRRRTMKTILLTAAGLLALAAAPAVAKPGHGNSHNHRMHSWSYGDRNCPPGLAKRNNGCTPPGIAKRQYNVGQRYSSRYGSRWNYTQIPYDMRKHYRLSSNDRYYYRDGYLYRVNPRTMLVEQVLSALTRPY